MYRNLIHIGCNKEIAKIFLNKLQGDIIYTYEISDNETDILNNAVKLEPNIILLPTENSDINGFEVCKKLRDKTFISRPVIIMLTNDNNDFSEKTIKALHAGADDVISLNISTEELSARVLAHLRRQIEQLSDYRVKLPSVTLINSGIKRNINLNTKWTLMLLSLNNFKFYSQTYGDLAANQLMKAFIAITKANTNSEDFVGYLGNENFAILTNPLKAELIAGHICNTVDLVVPKFYSPHEAERGFTILSDEGKASIKAPLVSVSIGIVSSEHRRLTNYKNALNFANDLKELAKKQIGSGWLIDRPLISTEEYIKTKKDKPYILVIESDAALAYLLSTTLEMEGYQVDATSNKNEALSFMDKKQPDIVLIDAVLPGNDGWDICSYIRTEFAFQNRTKIIMATVLPDKEKAFAAGADLYIPKPYELISLHKWINKLISNSI